MLSRRIFLEVLATPLIGKAEPIIDIHQHTQYEGRSDAELIRHQREMGATTTVLLPAGNRYGLAAGVGGNDTVVALARQYPKNYFFFANELPNVPQTRAVLEKYLNMGALGIGEQKFPVPVDSPYIDLIATIAAEHKVPILLHFEEGSYNLGFGNFHKVLARHSNTTFIGHAQTWWGNIDRNYNQKDQYPGGRVTPGGITDRLLSDYPNVYGDMSARSGLNAMLRDESHARSFLQRHQNKLLFGSDCHDRQANGPGCFGSQIISAIRRLAPDKRIERKLLYYNASNLLKIS